MLTGSRQPRPNQDAGKISEDGDAPNHGDDGEAESTYYLE
jgi:hypothetical protein